MNINLKKKRSLFAIAFLCLVVLVGITIAFFTSTSNIDNIFNSGTYKTVTTENFVSPTDWKPGDTTPKTITTKNEGTLPVRVRVKLTESWISEDSQELPIENNNERMAIINFANESDWIKDGDYYYYKRDLAPGESTTSLIESVTYNPNAVGNISCTADNGISSCKTTGASYDGGTYLLNCSIETVQIDGVLSAWNLEEDPVHPKYVVQITTSDGVTTKYETVESGVAALKNGDLFETIRKIEYDGVIEITNKEVTISGQIEFTSSEATIRVSGKTVTLKDLTITGISSYPVTTNGTIKSRNTKIYVGENSNVNITGVNSAFGNNYGKIEIHSGTYTGKQAIYCGGSQSGGFFETEVYGTDTYLNGNDYIFTSFSQTKLTVGEEVHTTLSSSTGRHIRYQGGGATFNIPTTYSLHNAAGGACTINGVYMSYCSN